jgi:hypothetical protein
MQPTSLQEMQQMLQGFVQPWYKALSDPATAQQVVLRRLLEGYSLTRYGQEHNAGDIPTVQEYRSAFPIITYEDIKPLIERTMSGESELVLYEPPVGWAITRGTTKGESKFIPMTPTDLKMRVSAGRAMINYVLRHKAWDVLRGVNLNLNFPSVVGTVRMGDREVEYGYSSGIYVKHVSKNMPLRSLPEQDEIDSLGGGKTIQDWERRFELAYERCKEEEVSLVGGVAPTAVAFGRYLHKAHKLYPKDLWQVRLMTLGSVPGINTRYVPVLRAMYGQVDVLEIYGATEGMFGQQMDERRAWVPNYDLFFFEVDTARGLIMLHEMQPGERGSLVVSTPILPRYKIGDLIMAFDPPYFRCIGRDQPMTLVRYYWDRLMRLDFAGP